MAWKRTWRTLWRRAFYLLECSLRCRSLPRFPSSPIDNDNNNDNDGNNNDDNDKDDNNTDKNYNNDNKDDNDNHCHPHASFPHVLDFRDNDISSYH